MSNCSLLIHKSWKESMHTQHMEVFSLNQGHMVALLATSMWHAHSWGRQEACSLSKKKGFLVFFKTPVSDGGESDTALSVEPVHTEAITSNGALELYNQLKWNHRNLYTSCQISCYLSGCVARTILIPAHPHLHHDFFLLHECLADDQKL